MSPTRRAPRFAPAALLAAPSHPSGNHPQPTYICQTTIISRQLNSQCRSKAINLLPTNPCTSHATTGHGQWDVSCVAIWAKTLIPLLCHSRSRLQVLLPVGFRYVVSDPRTLRAGNVACRAPANHHCMLSRVGKITSAHREQAHSSLQPLAVTDKKWIFLGMHRLSHAPVSLFDSTHTKDAVWLR
jgi:hypothetical protein